MAAGANDVLKQRHGGNSQNHLQLETQLDTTTILAKPTEIYRIAEDFNS